MSLKKDGRRVSLEGVLTGAALGIVLLYLVEDAAAAGAAPPSGGPLQDPGEVDPGSLGATAGRIQIRPLEAAVDRVLEAGVRTSDLASDPTTALGCRAMGERLLEALAAIDT